MMASMSSSCVHSIDLTQVGPEVVALIERLRNKVEAQAREIAVRDARLEKVNFELARLKRIAEAVGAT